MPDITNDDDAMTRVLSSKPRIAVVGASDNPARDSNRIFKFLKARGYDAIPVNPMIQELEGVQAAPDVAGATKTGPIQIVDVFRAADKVMPVVDEAIAVKAPVIWFQLGVVNPEAIDRALQAGLDVVVDRCIKVEIARLGL